jgi:hypothetical protein
MALPQGFIIEQAPEAAPVGGLPAGFQMETGTTATQPAEPVAPPSIIQQMFGMGSPIARFAKGAVVDPLLGVNQLLANTLPFGQSIREGANANVRSYDQATEQARAAQGSTGFDPIQLAGAVLSPANKLVGLTRAATGGGLAALGRASGTGAVLASVEPVRAPADQFTESKLTQQAVGAVLGPVVEGGLKTLGAVYGAVKGLTASGRETAMRTHLDSLVGPEKTAAIELMRDAKQLVTGSRPTVAETLADLPSAVDLMAAQKKLSSAAGTGRFFEVRTADNQAARLRAIDSIAGTPAERAAVAAERGSVTGPMRETALNQSDTAGGIVTKLEKEISDKYSSRINALQEAGKAESEAARQTTLSNTYSPVPGYPRVPGRYTEMAQRIPEYSGTATVFKDIAAQRKSEIGLKQFQLNSLEQNGFFPLKASDLTDQIDAAIRGARKDEVKAILQETKDKILSKADENGILNSRDLYENVRQSINRDITGYAAKAGRPFMGGLPEAEAKTAANVKKFIDSALDKSSDGLWTNYITSYTKYSNKLNRMEVGNFLSKKLNTPLDKESAGVFAAAVENAAATIKSSTGLPRYKNLSDVLSAGEVSTVKDVLADLQRTGKARELSSKIGGIEGGLGKPIGESIDVLSRTVSIMKAGIRYLQQGNQAEFNKKMSELMLDPQAAAQFMSSGIKQGKIAEFTSSLMKGMDAPTRAAFQQAFIIPAAAEEMGQ